MKLTFLKVTKDKRTLLYTWISFSYPNSSVFFPTSPSSFYLSHILYITSKLSCEYQVSQAIIGFIEIFGALCTLAPWEIVWVKVNSTQNVKKWDLFSRGFYNFQVNLRFQLVWKWKILVFVWSVDDVASCSFCFCWFFQLSEIVSVCCLN